MRTLLILAFAANVAVTLISLAVLPQCVAIHFGADGMANGWAPNHVNALLMTATHILMFCACYFSPRLALSFPAKWINLPNREFWLSPANRPRTMAKMQAFMWQFGVAVLLFLLLVSLLTLQANLAKIVKLDMRIFYPATGAFLVYTIGWTIALFRAFRLPREPNKQAIAR